jgi:hypothetical protein
MTTQRPDRVSVIDPITPAIERVKVMLFRPFNLRTWFVIGFCAWLAYLGSGGGGGGGGGPNFNVPHRQGHGAEVRDALNEAKEFLVDNLYWIIPVAVIIVVLIVGFALLIAWLNSRGRFMFLHCVAENKAEIKVPWRKFKKQANSLFLFRIVLGIISLVVVVLPIFGIVALIVMMIAGTGPAVVSISGIVVLGLLILVLSIALFLVKKFTMDFVVPIMFLRTANCMAGWREFMTILSANKLRFALYLLFQIVIAIVIGAIITLGFCIGCCLCCISVLLLIPYIGTVIILPLLVFDRAYSLYYLQQFGHEFDVFRTQSELPEAVEAS